ncbi:alpha/beta hydrolase [Aeromonas salmonicida]|uniref:alpha/beta hydrolase n=1 Tax=Aeromonas salmonicida TaxID=645 RepID=UPI001BA56419|nr:alpha/beta fold hydrolase [Aeromonas salmonicida]MBS2783128.1 alpha/beta fold hydrolase [Aeromonas salmonicida]
MIDIHPQDARHAVIWLHGLGDSGAGLAPLVDALDLPADLPVRHLLPDAPERPITINMGYKMRGWYDIKSFDDPADRAVEPHVRESAARIAALLDQLVAEGFAPERILLAGFSQGGVIASFTALRHPVRLAGLLCMSTYLAAPEQLVEEMSEAAHSLPICYMHGIYDDVVNLSMGWDAKNRLEAAGLTLEWHEYPMRHEICRPQLDDIRSWLLARLSA